MTKLPPRPPSKKPSKLTRDEAGALAKQAASGDMAARNKLVVANLGLLWQAAQRCSRWSGWPIEDLVQEGIFGLMKAAEKYDSGRASFATYSLFWIRQAMDRCIHNGGEIRIPVHQYEAKAKARAFKNKYSTLHGCMPTHEEIAQKIGISAQKMEIMADLPTTQSSDAAVRGGFTDTIGDRLPDEKHQPPEERLELLRVASEVKKTISKIGLTEREHTILKFRLMNDDDRETLQKIGARLGVTRERARQLEEKLLTKLRKKFEHMRPAQ